MGSIDVPVRSGCFLANHKFARFPDGTDGHHCPRYRDRRRCFSIARLDSLRLWCDEAFSGLEVLKIMNDPATGLCISQNPLTGT